MFCATGLVVVCPLGDAYDVGDCATVQNDVSEAALAIYSAFRDRKKSRATGISLPYVAELDCSCNCMACLLDRLKVFVRKFCRFEVRMHQLVRLIPASGVKEDHETIALYQVISIHERDSVSFRLVFPAANASTSGRWCVVYQSPHSRVSRSSGCDFYCTMFCRLLLPNS